NSRPYVCTSKIYAYSHAVNIGISSPQRHGDTRSCTEGFLVLSGEFLRPYRAYKNYLSVTPRTLCLYGALPVLQVDAASGGMHDNRNSAAVHAAADAIFFSFSVEVYESRIDAAAAKVEVEPKPLRYYG